MLYRKSQHHIHTTTYGQINVRMVTMMCIFRQFYILHDKVNVKNDTKYLHTYLHPNTTQKNTEM